MQALDPATHLDHRKGRNVGNAHAIELHAARLRVQAGALTAGAGLVADVLDLRLGEGLLAALVVFSLQGLVVGATLLARELDAGAHAVGAPAMLAVVGEQARIQFSVGGAAHRAGASGGKHLDLADMLVAFHPDLNGIAQTIQGREHMQHALAMLEGDGQMLAQHCLVLGPHDEVAHRQFHRVFLEAVQTWKACGGQEGAVDPQVRVATPTRPVGQLGVDALTVHHQRREQPDVLATVTLHDLRRDAVWRLRAHLGVVLHAMLNAQLHIEQTQEVPDLSRGAHRGFATTAREPLLDGHGRRNAVDRIHLRPACRLHDAARVGVQGLEVAALTLVEQDVEGQRGLARAGYAGDDAEPVVGDADRQRLQIVFARVDDLDRLGARG